MVRLIAFSRLTWPSTCPLLHGSLRAARTASSSRRLPAANGDSALTSASRSQSLGRRMGGEIERSLVLDEQHGTAARRGVTDHETMRFGQRGERHAVFGEQPIERLAGCPIVADARQAAAAPCPCLTDEHRPPVQTSGPRDRRPQIAAAPRPSDR